MPRKKANEATIAPPPVSDASVPVVKKTRKKAEAVPVAVKPIEKALVKPAKAAAPRRKTTAKVAEQLPNTSIAQLADAVETPVVFSAREIEERAYLSWIERGCPMGSPEEDWYRAERELIARFAGASK